jgi:hypothetical protein
MKVGEEPVSLGTKAWNHCPPNYVKIGTQMEPNGFWLCVRKDLAGKLFFVGDVENNKGKLYRVRNGQVEFVDYAGWGEGEGQEIARLETPNGFWIKMVK